MKLTVQREVDGQFADLAGVISCKEVDELQAQIQLQMLQIPNDREKAMLAAFRHAPPVIQDLYYACMRTFQTKGTDYTEGREDRLYNFRKAAEDLDITLPKVWYVYAWKHWTAIVRYVRHRVVASEPVWKRAMDVIVYLSLLVLFIQEEGDQPLPPSIESHNAQEHT